MLPFLVAGCILGIYSCSSGNFERLGSLTEASGWRGYGENFFQNEVEVASFLDLSLVGKIISDKPFKSG